jgi:hypothetical protein
VLEPYAEFLPGIVAALALTIVMGRRVGALLATGRVLGSVVALSLGVALAATVTPSRDALLSGLVGSGRCDLTRLALPSANQLAWPGDIVLNILLFVPLGLAIGLLPSSPAERRLVPFAYALPFAIEIVQLVVRPLGRECQTGDVVDNLTGLTIGILVGCGIRSVGGFVPRSGIRAAPWPLRPGVRLIAAGLAALLLLGSSVLTATAPADQQPRPLATPASSPTATPAPGESVRVASIPALLEALADPHLREIVVADGTYRVSPAGAQAADSLWIGDAFAGRTGPITVRAETPGGVTFDGGGATGFGGLWFVDGAHDQTWDGFTFANGSPTSTGVIMFGEGGGVAPHHITLRNITLASSLTGGATSASAPASDHGIYVSQATEGPHDLLFEDITVDGTGGLASAFHFYHSDSSHRNAWNVTVRRLHVRGTQQAIMLWDGTLRDITVDAADIVDALSFAVRYESPGATGIVLANVTSTGSGSGKGFHSSLGPNPPGVTFRNDSFR